VPHRYATIQAAVDAAKPGDLIRIAPGTYDETVLIPSFKRDLVVRGMDRNRVVLDGGGGRRAAGIVVHAQGVAIENLTVRRYRGDGIKIATPPGSSSPLRGWRVSYVTAAGNGGHGIAAVGVRGGTIDHVLAVGHPGAGLEVSHCRPCDALVTDSVAERDATGFESLDASTNVVVARSIFRDNRVGVTLASTGGDSTPQQEDAAVVGNLIDRNDSRLAPGTGPFGIGLLVRGGRRDGLARNRITGHIGAGLLLTGSDEHPAAEDSVQGNLMSDNRVDFAVLRHQAQRTSNGSCFAQNKFLTSAPSDIERALPCQSDVALRGPDPFLPSAPPGPDWRHVPLPSAQPSMPGAHTAKPQPARPPGRLDIAKVGVPGPSGPLQ
jgi:hypothetical protein